MSDIDHAAEARRLISDETLEVTLEGEESEVYAAAQVHATLALVAATEKVAEQARIANLIALGGKYVWDDGDRNTYIDLLHPQIKEGLGL